MASRDLGARTPAAATLNWRESRRSIPANQTGSGRKTVKVCMFHLMPYRDLPEDFGQRYNSAFIEPVWFDFADADKVGQYFNATLDELLYAANAGLHGVCTNQHHQNVYGFMANPSLMGSVLAKLTNGLNV